MKNCSYCGKQYSDDVTICPADGTPLDGALEARKKVTGVWRGTYGYGPREIRPGFIPTAFTLKLKQGWFAGFNGLVTEDQPQGMPGTGTVEGYFGSPKIEFIKQMPVGYFIQEDGTHMTFRDYLIAQGQPCKQDLPAPPILYQGTLLDGNRMQGIWTIDPAGMPMLRNRGIPVANMSGYWCAEFITADLGVNPNGGPRNPLFDKALLSARELEDVEGVAYKSLGRFNEAEFIRISERIVRTTIRFKTARCDFDPNQEATEEIFVHPEDMEEAKAILNSDT